jgi:hypothetical protein
MVNIYSWWSLLQAQEDDHKPTIDDVGWTFIICETVAWMAVSLPLALAVK